MQITENTITLLPNIVISKEKLTDLIDFVYSDLIENSNNWQYQGEQHDS